MKNAGKVIVFEERDFYKPMYESFGASPIELESNLSNLVFDNEEERFAEFAKGLGGVPMTVHATGDYTNMFATLAGYITESGKELSEVWVEKLSKFREYRVGKCFVFPNAPIIHSFYDEQDSCFKYYSVRGTGVYCDSYEEALRDELIGMGLLIPVDKGE